MWVILVRDDCGELRAKRSLQAGALTIGRAVDNDIVLPVPGASRHHGRVELRGEQLWYKDLGSANGSYADGRRVRGPVPLGADTAVTIAGQLLSVLPDPERSGLPELAVLQDAAPPSRPAGVADTCHWRTPTAQLEEQLRELRLRDRERTRVLRD